MIVQLDFSANFSARIFSIFLFRNINILFAANELLHTNSGRRCVEEKLNAMNSWMGVFANERIAMWSIRRESRCRGHWNSIASTRHIWIRAWEIRMNGMDTPANLFHQASQITAPVACVELRKYVCANKYSASIFFLIKNAWICGTLGIGRGEKIPIQVSVCTFHDATGSYISPFIQLSFIPHSRNQRTIVIWRILSHGMHATAKTLRVWCNHVTICRRTADVRRCVVDTRFDTQEFIIIYWPL